MRSFACSGHFGVCRVSKCRGVVGGERPEGVARLMFMFFVGDRSFEACRSRALHCTQRFASFAQATSKIWTAKMRKMLMLGLRGRPPLNFTEHLRNLQSRLYPPLFIARQPRPKRRPREEATRHVKVRGMWFVWGRCFSALRCRFGDRDVFRKRGKSEPSPPQAARTARMGHLGQMQKEERTPRKSRAA